MSRQDIEARLDRSLGNQIRAPRLDAGFNAAVWARIRLEEAPARIPQPVRESRWLLVSNLLGIAVTVALIVYVVARGFGGISVEVDLPVPAMSEQAGTSIMRAVQWGVAFLAVGFGFAFTRAGRRLVNFCRSEFA